MNSPPSPRSSARNWEWAVVAVALALLTASWLMPAEGGSEGEGAWRSLAWIWLAVAWLLGQVLSPAPSFIPTTSTSERSLTERLAPFLLHLAVGLLVVGHLLGGLVVLTGEGQKRIAANLMLDWASVGAAWIVLSGLLSRPRWQPLLMVPLCAAAVCMAALGLWQHFVSLPALAREMAPQLASIRQELATGSPGPASQALVEIGIPTTHAGLTLLEKRLLNSREPFAMFALANTFGGMLASAGLVLAVWLGWPRSRHEGGLQNSSPSKLLTLTIVTMLLLVAWCLLVTKSRTALLGAFAGAMVAVVLGSALPWVRSSKGVSRYGWWKVTLGIGLAILLVLLVLMTTGMWDWQVLQEAPKSLLYRWQYWVGSVWLIAKHPWTGIGLGQFQSLYPQVMLPEASEEIADPHNLWLDVWLNGGLLAVAGLIVLAIFLLFRIRSLSLEEGSQNDAALSNSSLSWSACGWGGVAGFLLVFSIELSSGFWDDRLLILLPLWGGAFWALTRVWNHSVAQNLPLWALAAVVALGVHLQGAGGIGMAAVTIWGLVLLQQSTGTVLRTETLSNPSSTAEPKRGATPQLWGCGLWLVFAVLITVFLWWPGVAGRQGLIQARQALLKGQTPLAIRSLETAARLDTWNPEPWEQLAELQFRLFRFDGDRTVLESQLEPLQKLLAMARQRDPQNARLLRRQAEITQSLGERLEDPALQEAATALYRQAWELNPNQPDFTAALALAEERVGHTDASRNFAVKALQQDELSRQLGHEDRWLDEALRQQLNALAPSLPVP